VSFIRLQAGLVRENVSLPDSVELGAHLHQPGAEHALLAFIKDAAESFVGRRVSPDTISNNTRYSGVARIWREDRQSYVNIICLTYSDTK